MGLDGPITLGRSICGHPTSHDAPAPAAGGWTQKRQCGFLTDTGYVTDEALDLLPGVDFVILGPTMM